MATNPGTPAKIDGRMLKKSTTPKKLKAYAFKLVHDAPLRCVTANLTTYSAAKITFNTIIIAVTLLPNSTMNA